MHISLVPRLKWGKYIFTQTLRALLWVLFSHCLVCLCTHAYDVGSNGWQSHAFWCCLLDSQCYLSWQHQLLQVTCHTVSCTLHSLSATLSSHLLLPDVRPLALLPALLDLLRHSLLPGAWCRHDCCCSPNHAPGFWQSAFNQHAALLSPLL